MSTPTSALIWKIVPTVPGGGLQKPLATVSSTEHDVRPHHTNSCPSAYLLLSLHRSWLTPRYRKGSDSVQMCLGSLSVVSTRRCRYPCSGFNRCPRFFLALSSPFR